MAIQDDSNRFDNKDSFDIEGTPPPQWRPWAAAPMTGRFKLAFELDPAAGSLLRYSIGEAFAKNVVTSNDPQAALDADNGTEHALKYNGRILLRVEETQPSDNDVGVTFTNVCRRTNGVLQGYLSLTTKIGIDNVGKEGYHVLYVLADKQNQTFPPVNVPPSQIDTVISMKGDPSSLRPNQDGDKRGLRGNLSVDIKALKPSQDTRVQKVEFVTPGSRRELTFKSARGSTGTVGDLSLLEPGQLVFQLRSGKTIPMAWPGIGVAGLVQQQVSAASVAPISTWSTMFKAAGGKDVQPVAALKVMRVDRMELLAMPQYGLLKDGRVGLAEDSPFVERLNAVLDRGNADEISKIMGTAQPVNIEWSIKATNLATGYSVPIENRNRNTGESVVVTELEGKGVSKKLQIDFPSTNSVYEVLITAKVSDVFGSTTLIESRVGNYFLNNDSPNTMVNALLPAVAAAAGVSETDLLASMRIGIIPLDDSRHRNPQVRRSLVIRNVALQAADDKQISLNELAALIRGARLYGEPPSRKPVRNPSRHDLAHFRSG